jgi:hypothetical protein
MDLIGTLIPTLNSASVLMIIPPYRRFLCSFRATKTDVITTNFSQTQGRSCLPSTIQEGSPQKSPNGNDIVNVQEISSC